MSDVFELEYKINTTNIDCTKKLSLFGLLQMVQDIASEHAHSLGFGYEAMQEKGFFWVLIRQKIKMKKWPTLYEKLSVKTWLQPIERFLAIREFAFFSETERIGECSTTWMILDSVHRKPKKIPPQETFFEPREDLKLDFRSEKITLPDAMEEIGTHSVQISDLDLNGHVNNAHYSQWIINSIPFEKYEKLFIKEFEINFLAESLLQENILCFASVDKMSKNTSFFMGKGALDEKIKYTASLVAE